VPAAAVAVRSKMMSPLTVTSPGTVIVTSPNTSSVPPVSIVIES
jgi:hypothetical protein